jgi:hypothetical protein
MNLPADLPAMLAALLAEHYNVTFTLDYSGRADYLVDMIGPLGSQATGLGDTPAAALASVWPFGDTYDGQDDDDVIDGPAVAAAARKMTVLGDYVSGVLASGGELVSHRHALECVAGEMATIGALLAADPVDVEDGPGYELEPYCRPCGQWIGHFLGLDGWQHFRGEPAAGGRRTLYDAGHEADPAWCVPPGRSLAPAEVAVIRDALADTPACAALLDRLAAAGRFGDML